jgi:hypothetical protein
MLQLTWYVAYLFRVWVATLVPCEIELNGHELYNQIVLGKPLSIEVGHAIILLFMEQDNERYMTTPGARDRHFLSPIWVVSSFTMMQANLVCYTCCSIVISCVCPCTINHLLSWWLQCSLLLWVEEGCLTIILSRNSLGSHSLTMMYKTASW